MDQCPSYIGNAKVVCYAVVNDAAQATNATKHTINTLEADSPAGLAICHLGDESACYLFGCTDCWEPITDTWHASVTEAKNQGEFEFNDITWQPSK